MRNLEFCVEVRDKGELAGLIGIYGPYPSRDAAEAAALPYVKPGVQLRVFPLWPASQLGSW